MWVAEQLHPKEVGHRTFSCIWPSKRGIKIFKTIQLHVTFQYSNIIAVSSPKNTGDYNTCNYTLYNHHLVCALFFSSAPRSRGMRAITSFHNLPGMGHWASVQTKHRWVVVGGVLAVGSSL